VQPLFTSALSFYLWWILLDFWQSFCRETQQSICCKRPIKDPSTPQMRR